MISNCKKTGLELFLSHKQIWYVCYFSFLMVNFKPDEKIAICTIKYIE